MTGVPVGITLATSGFVFGFLGFGDDALRAASGAHLRRRGQLSVARDPAVRLHGRDARESRLAEDLLDVTGHLSGGVRGGMASVSSASVR